MVWEESEVRRIMSSMGYTQKEVEKAVESLCRVLKEEDKI